VPLGAPAVGGSIVFFKLSGDKASRCSVADFAGVEVDVPQPTGRIKMQINRSKPQITRIGSPFISSHAPSKSERLKRQQRDLRSVGKKQSTQTTKNQVYEFMAR